MSIRAVTLLNKTGLHISEIGNNIYSYFLTVRDTKGNDLSMDALLLVEEDKFFVLKVWEMVFDSQRLIFTARNIDGEYGVYAKELAKKYMTAFLLSVYWG